MKVLRYVIIVDVPFHPNQKEDTTVLAHDVSNLTIEPLVRHVKGHYEGTVEVISISLRFK